MKSGFSNDEYSDFSLDLENENKLMVTHKPFYCSLIIVGSENL